MTNERLAEVERLLCERYNVSSLDGLGSLPEAVEAARAGDLGPLQEALDGRELYRWRDPISKAMRALTAPVVEADEASEIPGVVEERPDGDDDGEIIEAFLPDESEAPMAAPRGRKKN